MGGLGFHPGNVLILEKRAWAMFTIHSLIHPMAILTLTKPAQIPYAPGPEAVKREPLRARHDEEQAGASAGAGGDRPPELPSGKPFSQRRRVKRGIRGEVLSVGRGVGESVK